MKKQENNTKKTTDEVTPTNQRVDMNKNPTTGDGNPPKAETKPFDASEPQKSQHAENIPHEERFSASEIESLKKTFVGIQAADFSGNKHQILHQLSVKTGLTFEAILATIK